MPDKTEIDQDGEGFTERMGMDFATSVVGKSLSLSSLLDDLTSGSEAIEPQPVPATPVDMPEAGPSKRPRKIDDHRKGHRARLRERFMSAGAASVADYEMLELLLFRAIPRR
ncbi:MAG: hypothetical protein AAGJ28_09710, partial [Pseudomonadota bacterium]